MINIKPEELEQSSYINAESLRQIIDSLSQKLNPLIGKPQLEDGDIENVMYLYRIFRDLKVKMRDAPRASKISRLLDVMNSIGNFSLFGD